MAAQPRFREPDGLAWRDPVYVACPRCEGRATVRSPDRCTARMVCAFCALTRDWSNDRLFVLVDGHPVELRRDHGAWMNAKTGQYVQRYETPQGQDPRFGVLLWLRIGFCGGQLLWANNQDHLAYLEAYVGAGLRERPEGGSMRRFGLTAYFGAWGGGAVYSQWN